MQQRPDVLCVKRGGRCVLLIHNTIGAIMATRMLHRVALASFRDSRALLEHMLPRGLNDEYFVVMSALASRR